MPPPLPPMPKAVDVLALITAALFYCFDSEAEPDAAILVGRKFAKEAAKEFPQVFAALDDKA